jgi:hypothetical protein
MPKKQLDNDEVQSRWHQFIKGVEGDPALQSFFQRHRGVGEEPRMLFEAVGEDLASSREEKREQAFWILVAGMPELADILHEREWRHPGWRSGAGKGQQAIDRGMDIVTSLYVEFVKEHKFNTERGKDPRPYVRTKARNWKIDGWRKERRAVSLDEPLNDEAASLGSLLATTLPDPTAVEDELVDKLYYEHGMQQLRAWDFLQDEELGWFAETLLASRPIDSLDSQFDTPARKAARLRQRRSRVRRKVFERLESIVVWYLINFDWKGSRVKFRSYKPRTHPRGLPTEEGAIQEAVRQLLGSWVWEWAQRAVRLGPLEEWGYYRGYYNGLIIRPLTHRFDGSPGHLFFITFKENKEEIKLLESMGYKVPRKVRVFDLPGLEQIVNKALEESEQPGILYYPNFNTMPLRFLEAIFYF